MISSKSRQPAALCQLINLHDHLIGHLIQHEVQCRIDALTTVRTTSVRHELRKCNGSGEITEDFYALCDGYRHDHQRLMKC